MAILALESRVLAVTVYRSGALVTRRAALVRGADGYPESVRVTGLPLSLDDGSMRVRLAVDSDGELPIATGLRIALDVPDALERVEPPQDAEIAEARRQTIRLQIHREQLAAEIELLRNLSSPPRPDGAEGQPPPPVPTASRLELVSFRHEELERRQALWRQSTLDLGSAQERLAHLEHRYQRATTARPARENELRKSAVIALSAREARAGRAWLDIEYLVPGARWLPAYALELDAECTKGTLVVRALVAQSTGEDWPGVMMKLSTADSLSWSELPELTSVRIGRRQAGSGKRGWVPPPTGAAELYADYDRAMVPAPADLGAGSAAEGPATNPGYPMNAPVPQQEMRKDARTRGAAMKRGARPRDSYSEGAADEKMAVSMEAPMAPPPIMQPAPAMMSRAKSMPSAQSGMHVGGISGGIDPHGSMADGFGGSAAPRRRPPPPPDVLRAADEMMAFGRLRMPPPGGSGRGELAPVPLSQEYSELLAELRVDVMLNVLGAVAEARSVAGSPAHRDLPARHHEPHSVDGFDFAYRADFPLDVPSDGDFHGVTLARREGPVELKHVSVPRETADVFRVASLVNPLDAPLLDGPVDVSIAGAFRLTAPLRTVPPRARLDLGLGVEPAIKVARNTRYREEAGGLMSSSLTLEHEIVIDVVNHLKRRASVEVRERVPVAREGDDQATVNVTGAHPAWKDYAPRDQALRGGHAWNIAVEPGEKQTLRATYTIGISSKNELTGGNRREG